VSKSADSSGLMIEGHSWQNNFEKYLYKHQLMENVFNIQL